MTVDSESRQMEELDNLFQNSLSSCGFFRPIWYRAWDLSYGNDRNWSGPLRFIPIVCDGAIQAALPISSQKIGPFRFAAIGGAFSPFRGIPYRGDPGIVAQTMVAEFDELRGIDAVRLGPVQNTESLLTSIIVELKKANWKIITETLGVEYVLDNLSTLDNFKATLSKSRLKRIDVYWRRLCRDAETTISHYNSCSESEWAKVFQEFETIESNSWVAKSGDPYFIGEVNQQFWNLLVTDPWFRDSINAWTLYHDGRPVSFLIAMDSDDTRFFFVNGYDERVAKYSTGRILYKEGIYDSFTKNITRINSGQGDSGYKRGWGGTGTSELVNIVAFPPTLRGRTAFVAGKTKKVIERIRSAISTLAKFRKKFS
jgi:hypothetical protein